MFLLTPWLCWFVNISITEDNKVVYCCIWVRYLYFYFDRVPCRSGMCTTPLHVTSSQLIASEIFPVAVVKTLLYPGAAANSLVKNFTIPSWDNLLDIYNLTSVKEAPAVTDLQRLEVLFNNWSLPLLIVLMHIPIVWGSLQIYMGGWRHLVSY